MEDRVFGLEFGHVVGTIYGHIDAAAREGMDFKTAQQAAAVDLAIQSGEMSLPWSQEECESFSGDGPDLESIQELMDKHPEFTPVACAWAYAGAPALFPALYSYVS